MKSIKLLLITLFSFILLYIIYYFIFPDIAKLKKENPQKTSFMEYREKEWQKQDRRIEIKQIWAPLSQISPYLIKSVLIAEDDKFYQHEGFDFEVIEKAVEKDTII